MATYLVTCFGPDGDELEFNIQADDEAAALGLVLDEYGHIVAHGSPFVVERTAAPARRCNGRRGSRAGSKGSSKAAEAVPGAVIGAVGVGDLPQPVQELLAKVSKETGCAIDE